MGRVQKATIRIAATDSSDENDGEEIPAASKEDGGGKGKY